MKNDYKIGDRVTASSINEDGDTIYISGTIRSISDGRVFIEKRFPKLEHFSVKHEDIILRNE